ncbi:hypothetical protein BRD19_04270 [Halobacteriales archaeon SW_7_65_23]|nr:MAG: hypothetical protein BRD19_04270 [Halobacteriales archaeon SW_7_65_23]
MTQERGTVEDRYEIALAIGRGNSLRATTERALSAYVEKLGCSGGAVLERPESSREYRLIESQPGDPAADSGLQAGIEHLRTGSVEGGLPVRGESGDGAQYCVMSLPSFGAIVLATPEQAFEEATVAVLAPLNEKLAAACREQRTETALREDRDRFEALFETIQEPLVHAVFRENEPIVKRINAAFEETFGYSAEEAIGESVNELIVPPEERARDEAQSLDEYALEGRTMTREVRRETADGMGDFLFRGAPVETGGDHEHFGMYVDITEKKTRQRRLEQLYEETEQIFTANSRQAVCRYALAAADGLIGASTAGVHLYDRSAEALVPTATNQRAEAVFEGESGPYTDRNTVVWEVYDSGEPAMIHDMEQFDGRLPGGETPVESLIVLPLGKHGVFIVSATGADAFDEIDFDFLRLLSALVETALDRTTRTEGLEEIQGLTRDTLAVDTHEEVAEAVLARIPEVLDMPLSTIWEYDAGQDALVPLAATEKASEVFDEIPTFSTDDSIVWQAFQDGEIRLIPDVDAHSDVHNKDTIIGSEIVVPIGEFGVLITGSTYSDSFGESERRLLETLSANVETTMRLTSRRRELELLDQVLARILRHNIRNVLTIIKGFARQIQQEGNREAAAHAQRIIDRSESLQSTAEHARDIRHIITNRERREEFPLQAVVERVVTTVRSEYPSVRVRTTFDAEPTVLVHPDLPVAVRHLVENGIEHAEEETTPQIEITVSTSNDGAVLEIADNGPGIPDHEIEVLETHGESALEHGSGAGLWLIDRIVNYSDATIEFDRTDDGSVATITFEQA